MSRFIWQERIGEQVKHQFTRFAVSEPNSIEIYLGRPEKHLVKAAFLMETIKERTSFAVEPIEPSGVS